MKSGRTALLILLTLGGLFTPLTAEAETADKLPRVGFVLTTAPLPTMDGVEPQEPVMRGFLHGLRALGYVEGQNIIIERRSAEGKLERLEDLIRGLAQAPVDVIVVTGNPMTLVAKKITTTIRWPGWSIPWKRASCRAWPDLAVISRDR